MNLKTWSGPFHARQRGPRLWILAADDAARTEVHLIGADVEPTLASRAVDRIEIDWGRVDGAVDVTLAAGGRSVHVPAQAAIVHQALPRLYDDLPLERFGERSRIFWKRIFRLVRIPGGRFVLNYIARRARA